MRGCQPFLNRVKIKKVERAVGDPNQTLIHRKITTIQDRCCSYCTILSVMEKKMNDMLGDMLNHEDILNSSNADTNIPNGLVDIDFSSKTVSARALHEYLDITERFSKWCQRIFSYGFVENVDYKKVNFFVIVNNGAKNEVGEYLFTIDMAQHIIMMQRSDKGYKARQYFVNIEKLYFKIVHSTDSPAEKSTV
jgi:phage anti-repressor protein